MQLMRQRRDTRSRDHQRVKLPLVYILSTGRSGSTLLDVLLGAQPECWTLGEFQLLDIGAGRQLQCGCHSLISRCSFWGPLLDRIRQSIRFPLGYFRSGRHPNGKVIRWPLLPSLLTGRPLPIHRPAAEAYAISNLTALDEARCAAEQHQDKVTWLIDASKDPYRLFWLQASGHFDIRVVHLVRRPEGFVCNMMRSAGISGVGPVARYALRWTVDNLISLVLLWRMFWPDAVRTIHYEKLATDPEGTVGELCTWLNVPFDPQRTRTTRFAVNHGIAGNRPRWEDLAVVFEERWRTAMSPLHQRLVTLLTAPLMRWRSPEPATGAYRIAATGRRRQAPPWATSRSGRP